MEQNPGENAHKKIIESHGVTLQKLKDILVYIEPEMTLSQADIIRLMSKRKADVTEAQRIDQEVGGFLKTMIADGYLVETNEKKEVRGLKITEPAVSYKRTSKKIEEEGLREAA